MKLFAITGLFLFGAISSSFGQTFSNPASITIPNAGFLQGPASPYPSAINVSGAGTQLASISVTMADFSHFYPADVDVLLVGPQGQNVMLMSDVGSFFPVTGRTFMFNNTAGTSMPSAAQLNSGTYAPTNFDPVGDVDGFPAPAPMVGPYGSAFNPFLGTDPNGTWSLYLLDDVAGNDGQLAGGWSLTITTSGAPALQLTGAASRKTHGGAGDFDVDLPLTGEPGVECRSGAAGHTLIFTFTNNIVSGSASVTGGTGSVSGSPAFFGNTMTVNLTGVPDVQTLAVTLSGVTDSFAQVLPNTVVSAHFLLGDTTENKSVNASDVGQIKGQSGSPVTAANFRTDLGANGAINASDVGQAKAASGNSITSPLLGAYFDGARNLQIVSTEDGYNWTTIRANAYAPASGDLRDPSIIQIGSTLWVCYTSGTFGAVDYFSIIKSIDGGLTWTFVKDVTVVSGADHTWGPEWFLDSDGSLHVTVAVSTNGVGTDSNMHMYEVHPTTSDPAGTWSSATSITMTDAAVPYDNQIVLVGNVYHAIITDAGFGLFDFTSTTLLGPYSNSGGFIFNGSPMFGIEAPDVFRLPHGGYGLVFMENGLKYASSLGDLHTWSAPVSISCTGGATVNNGGHFITINNSNRASQRATLP